MVVSDKSTPSLRYDPADSIVFEPASTPANVNIAKAELKIINSLASQHVVFKVSNFQRIVYFAFV
jgi:hypothetical protein